MLPVSLDCPFFTTSVFSNIYLSCVFCILCCQFLWNVYFWLPLVFRNVYLSCFLCTLCCQVLGIVYFWLPLWYSLTFICLVSCVLYVASFSGMSIFDCPLVFPNVYLSCFLCTLCCQFLWNVYFWLSLWYSLTFICLVSCVPYVARFSGMSIFDCPLVFPNVYLSCVLCTLCCQFLWIVYFVLPLGIP